MQNPNYYGTATGKSAIGLDGNLTAALGYIIGLLALVLIFMEKDNRFVRFHAIQSVLYSVMIMVVVFALMIVLAVVSGVLAMVSGELAALSTILWFLLFLGLGLAAFAGGIFAAYKAYQGQTFKLPVVGGFAQNLASK